MKKEDLINLKKVLYVFTKDFQKEVKSVEFKKKMRDDKNVKFQSNPDQESIDTKIARLRKLELTKGKKPSYHAYFN